MKDKEDLNMQNPEQNGHPFRFKADTRSDLSRTPVPEQSGHPFRFKTDTFLIIFVPFNFIKTQWPTKEHK